MKPSVIDTSKIEAMVAQLRAAAARPPDDDVGPAQAGKQAQPVDFSAALKASLDQVNDYQHKADELGKRFAMGDDSVNLSDVMISMQKASIALQTTVQVRNKLVNAYQEIMNMQV